MQAQLKFETDFDSANGTAFSEAAPNVVSFEVRPDTNSDDRQWFHFRLCGAKGRRITFRMANAGATNVPAHWHTSLPVFSADNGATWARIDRQGHFDISTGVFEFEHAVRSDAELLAMHFPYTYTHLLNRLADWRARPGVLRETIGHSIEGRDIEMLTLGTPRPRKRGIWLTARQHAAETSCSHTLDGLIEFLLSTDPRATALREIAFFHIVPMINPDGVVHGNYRDNAKGINLNRFWNNADETNSPEVFAVMRALDNAVASGESLDMFIDFHSDSCAQEHYAFHAAPNHQPHGYHAPEQYFHDVVRFLNLVAANAPEFLPGKGMTFIEDAGISYHHIREKYGVLAMIPEAGYNRVSHGAAAGTYLSPERHAAVGKAFGIALGEFFAHQK